MNKYINIYKINNALTTTYAPELVTLVVAFHMCYEASTLSLTQVIVAQLTTD